MISIWLGIYSFKGRLRFIFISLTVLIVLSISIPLILLGKKQQLSIAHNSLNQIIYLQEVAIGSWLDDKLAEIKSMASLPTIKAENYQMIEEMMYSFDNNHFEFEGVVLVNDEGISVIDTYGSVGIDLSDRKYFEKGKQGQAYVSDVIIGRQSNRPIVTVSSPVYNYDGEFYGVIFGAIPIETINKIMSNYQAEDRETFLVNREGLLITDSKQGILGEYIGSEIYRKAVAGLTMDHFYANLNGEEVIGNYSWVHDNQWLIVGEIDKKTIYELFNRMVTIFVINLILLLLIGSVLILRISNRVEIPVQNMLEGTRKIGEGDWKYRLTPQIGGTNEFTELTENFNHMAELIENHIHSIAEREERFRTITENSSDVIAIHDSKGRFIYMSPVGKEVLQYDMKEVVGMTLQSIVHPNDFGNIVSAYKNKGNLSEVTFRIRRRDGIYIWFESSMKILHEKNLDNEQIISISRNITERKQIEERLTKLNQSLLEMSTKDGLTNVWNRRYFDEQLEIEWDRAIRSETNLSLIMIDIDYFKKFNDKYGHQVGDDCLREVAKTIETVILRPADKVFRYGGEEFSVLLPETDIVGVKLVAEKIRTAIESQKIPHADSEISKFVTVSLGAHSVIPTTKDLPRSFIERADAALYEAKRSGRNRVKCSIEIL